MRIAAYDCTPIDPADWADIMALCSADTEPTNVFILGEKRRVFFKQGTQPSEIRAEIDRARSAGRCFPKLTIEESPAELWSYQEPFIVDHVGKEEVSPAVRQGLPLETIIRHIADALTRWEAGNAPMRAV